MSGVIGVGPFVTRAGGPDIPTVCDALIAAARAAGHEPGPVTLIHPLDGRHNLAHIVLEEATRRGWTFGRHPPAGAEPYLVDLDGPDAEPALGKEEASARFSEIGDEVRSAIDESELGEALAGLRQALALAWRHYGPWHPDTWWAASNLLRIAGGTGARANIDEAAALISILLDQPFPAEFENAIGTARKLDETARNCVRAGHQELAIRVMDSAVALARQAFGEDHPNHLAMLNNTAMMLSALKSPRAEPALRDLLRLARATLGERHPNVAVVLNNLAEHLEDTGRAAEGAPLREEARAIKEAAPS